MVGEVHKDTHSIFVPCQIFGCVVAGKQKTVERGKRKIPRAYEVCRLAQGSHGVDEGLQIDNIFQVITHVDGRVPID